ncbi:MAG: sulfurtransferase TusA family protein [Armatimonadetes bacterium]|nr:sulfurtransferase TusA family protein [Armatimonadota bacterium]
MTARRLEQNASAGVPEVPLVDCRGVACPTNFVLVKLALEELDPGGVLDVLLDEGQPMRNVPRSVKEDGHRVVTVEPQEDGSFRLRIRCGA